MKPLVWSISNADGVFSKTVFLNKWAILGPFVRFYFNHFKQTLQQINVNNVHPVFGAGIRTHDLQNKSLLP